MIGLPWWLSCREFICQSRRCESRVRKIPWGRKWQPTLVFLPGKSHGLRSLVGYQLAGEVQDPPNSLAFVNKILLIHSHVHLYKHCPWLLLPYKL